MFRAHNFEKIRDKTKKTQQMQNLILKRIEHEMTVITKVDQKLIFSIIIRYSKNTEWSESLDSLLLFSKL